MAFPLLLTSALINVFGFAIEMYG